jgi:thiol-disulfide isomerase/thioredoxin
MVSKKYLTYIGIGLFATLILAACGGSGNPVGSLSSDANPTNLEADFLIEVYQGAEVLGGEQVLLSDVFASGKPVVLNFWAGLCPPCRLEMPDFQAVYDEYGGQVLFFGLDVGTFTSLGTPEEGRALLYELGVTYPAGTTSKASVMVDYRVIGMPSTFFLTPSGEIIRTWSGLLTKDKLSELIDELLTASGIDT